MIVIIIFSVESVLKLTLLQKALDFFLLIQSTTSSKIKVLKIMESG